jgi:hypothetical protein
MSQRCSRGAERVRRIALVAGLAAVGCRQASPAPAGRYVVTATPLVVGLAGDKGLCIAVDPGDPHGVWWWEPGASGCTRRSTGPGVFHADQAVVARSTEIDVATVAFRLQLHSPRPPAFLDVRLIIEDGTMRTLDYRSTVMVHRRQDLVVPEELPGAR